MRTVPNLISLLRLIFAPCVFLLAYMQETKLAFTLFTLLALSDAIDGIIARLFKSETELGKFLDPVADKALLLFGLLSVTTQLERRAEPFLLQLQICRDLFLILGTLLLRRWGFVPEPSTLGKVTTFVLFMTVFVVLLYNLFPSKILIIPFYFLETASMVLMIISALDYALKGANFLLSKLIMEKQ